MNGRDRVPQPARWLICIENEPAASRILPSFLPSSRMGGAGATSSSFDTYRHFSPSGIIFERPWKMITRKRRGKMITRFVRFVFFLFSLWRKIRNSKEDAKKAASRGKILSHRTGGGEGDARHRYAGYPGQRKESETSINSYFGRTLYPVSCLSPSRGGERVEVVWKEFGILFWKESPFYGANAIPLFAHPSLLVSASFSVEFRERLRRAWLRST